MRPHLDELHSQTKAAKHLRMSVRKLIDVRNAGLIGFYKDPLGRIWYSDEQIADYWRSLRHDATPIETTSPVKGIAL